MNNIPQTQNENRQLERLAAQRNLYSSAKSVFGVQVILGGPVAILIAFLAAAIPEAKGYAAFWGILVSLSDVAWLTPWQKRLRGNAARIQELFDCEVLQLPWNDIKVGKKPEPEFVKQHSDKYDQIAHKFTPIANWYSPSVQELPLEIARVVCQRSNIWWDSNQRRRYANWVIGVVATISLCMLAVGFVGGLSIEKFFLAIVAPLSPAIILGVRQFTEQREAANRLDHLMDHARELFNEACSWKDKSNMETKSRVLQDEIFDNRKRSPLVFDWIFRRLRDEYEAQMNHGVDELVAEANRRPGSNELPNN